MLVLRKEIKIGIGAGLTILGIAAVYGLIAALSSSGPDANKQSAAIGGNAAQVAAVTDRGNEGGLPPKIDEPDPLAVKPEAPSRDPFAESNHPGGNKTTDPWATALRTGRVGGGDVVKNPSVIKAPTDSAITDAKLVSAPPAGSENGKIVSPLDAPRKAGAKNNAGNNSGAGQATSGKYVVQSGDTFSTIAKKQYGSKAYAPALIKANPDVNPSRLRIGKEITVPPKEEVATVGGAGSVGRMTADLSGPIDASRQYRVATGDTLSSISGKLYRTSNKWESLYETNKAAIGSDPARLKVGTLIDLPQKPVR